MSARCCSAHRPRRAAMLVSHLAVEHIGVNRHLARLTGSWWKLVPMRLRCASL